MKSHEICYTGSSQLKFYLLFKIPVPQNERFKVAFACCCCWVAVGFASYRDNPTDQIVREIIVIL